MAPQNSGVSYDTKTIIVVLLLVFVYPIGLILMYIWMKWPGWVKLILSLPVVLLVLGIVASVLLVAINPAAQVRKANCVKSCEASQGECYQRCIGQEDSF